MIGLLSCTLNLISHNKLPGYPYSRSYEYYECDSRGFGSGRVPGTGMIYKESSTVVRVFQESVIGKGIL